MIVGMALGDGNLTSYKKSINPSIRINHSSKQKCYLKWKIKLLQNIYHYDLMRGYRESKIRNNQNGKIYKVCSFYGGANSKLKTVWKKLYKSKKKIYTREILDFLTPLGIAIWYMDDGCLNYKGGTVMISTYCSKEENEICRDYFLEKWGIEWNIGKHKDKYFLVRGMKSDDMQRFKKLIQKYIIPFFHYKIDKITPTLLNRKYDIVRHS